MNEAFNDVLSWIFEWDKAKRLSNLAKHGLDFEDCLQIFLGACFMLAVEVDGEERFKAIGVVEGREVTVVFTMRGTVCRIISARRARTNEREAYHAQKAGRSAPGADGLAEG